VRCSSDVASGVCAGTGKTISLICSTLQWLEDRRADEAAAAACASSTVGGPTLADLGAKRLACVACKEVHVV